MSRQVQWSSEKTFQLIDYYEKAPMLWNSKHSDFKNRDIKQCAIVNIAKSLNVDPPTITKKLHNLRGQMNEEMRKCKQHMVANANDDWQSKWAYFDAMAFITTSPSYRGSVKLTSENLPAKFEIVEQNVTAPSAPPKKQRKPKPKLNINNSEKNIQYPSTNPSTSTSQVSVGTQCTLTKNQKLIDENEAFGNYVSSELRLMQSDAERIGLRMAIKRTINAYTENNSNYRVNVEPMPELDRRTSTRSSRSISVTSRETVIYSPRSHRSGNMYGDRAVSCGEQIANATDDVLIQEDSEQDCFDWPAWGKRVKQEYYE